MSDVQTLLRELQKHAVVLSIEGDRLVLQGQQPLKPYLMQQVREQKMSIIAALTEDTRPGETLTDERIGSYQSLDDHSRAVLDGFATSFPGSTITWLSRKREAQKGDAE